MGYSLDWKDCQRIAELACYSAGIHREDRKDFIQDVLVEMMERARRDSGGLSTKELWRAARCVRSRYWRAYKKARRISSLNVRVRDTQVELHETIADDKAADLDALLDVKSRLENLPARIVCIGKKLLKGDPITKNQWLYLSRFQDGEVKRNKGTGRYQRLRAKGRCVSCGEESGNLAQCPGCRERHRADQKKHREKKGTAWIKTVRDHWRKQGRCPRCGGIPEPGHKTCLNCLVKNRKYLRKHRERRATTFMEKALV